MTRYIKGAAHSISYEVVEVRPPDIQTVVGVADSMAKARAITKRLKFPWYITRRQLWATSPTMDKIMEIMRADTFWNNGKVSGGGGSAEPWGG